MKVVDHIWKVHLSDCADGRELPPANKSQLLGAVNGTLERNADTEHIFQYLNDEYRARNLRTPGLRLEEPPAPVLVVDAVLQDSVAVATSDIEPEVPSLPDESTNQLHK